MKPNVKLVPLRPEDRNQFILDNQEAFQYGALEEFGKRDEHYEDGRNIISRRTIEESLDMPSAEVYRILADGEKAGGVVLQIDKKARRGDLDILFTLPCCHGRGIGYAAWCEVEKLHLEIRTWECWTPYFETRNIHFYINKCGFHAVEFFGPFHTDSRFRLSEGQEGELFFRFEKKK